jgi:HSP20 family molecular chaperone IbpA
MTMEGQRPESGLIPWKPMGELEELERHFEDLFGQPVVSAAWGRLPVERRGWTPAIEIFEKEDRFLMKVELPGIKGEDIDVSAVGDTLTVRGERRALATTENVQEMAIVVPNVKNSFSVYFLVPTENKSRYFCCYKKEG